MEVRNGRQKKVKAFYLKEYLVGFAGLPPHFSEHGICIELCLLASSMSGVEKRTAKEDGINVRLESSIDSRL